MGPRTLIRETHYTDATGACVRASDPLETPIDGLIDVPDATWQSLLKHACDTSLGRSQGACDIRMFKVENDFEWEGGTLGELILAMDTAARAEGQLPMFWRIRQAVGYWTLGAASMHERPPEPPPNREAILEHNRRLGEINQQVIDGQLDSEAAGEALQEAERALRQAHGQEAP